MKTQMVEVLVERVISRFVEKMVAAARAHLEAELRGFSVGGEPKARRERERPVSEQEAFARMVPGKRAKWVHAADHVERLIELVRKHPWPPRSKELQVLLGVKKDPFLRIVDLALASGRLRREGQRSGTKYFVV